ncbi:cysteine-rich KTR domain-containing protein [Enterococcus termitis]|jgi:Zn-finger nucleic acid-binding protein|uniref:Conjugal transfer protein n=1 Tax=Enterococcus termitis TaxID=332950 RepID=A0A1E5GYG9_9ENTE|nr:cysteine-rich KTR domain-containing protein [Enterococcus termitis]OEG17728.1 conjugal transfer protein [Enterococcus termitis]
MIQKHEWVLCPACSNKTRMQIRGDTEIKNLPLYCPKCKKESLIDVKQYKISIIKEPVAKT